MPKLSREQAHLIITLFQLQNTDKEVREFITFGQTSVAVKPNDKIGDLILENNRVDELYGRGGWWLFRYWENIIWKWNFNTMNSEPFFNVFDYISFEDKV
jgi:hypothetical protein